MRITAVICTFNRPDLIRGAVDSVLANDHADFELVVVDQSTSGATQRELDDRIADDPRLQYIHTERVGLSAAYNVGINRASGALLAFTDDDCLTPVDWLRTIEQAFVEEPAADLLYGQVLIPASLRTADGIVPHLPIVARRRISRRDGFMIYGMGANFAARRRLFDIVGGFDEVLGGGGPLRSSQDFDLQYRVFRAGLVTLLAPSVKIDHYGLRSAEQWPQTLTAYGVGDGGFYMKHIRCGDLFALRLLGGRLAWHLPRLTKLLLRRPYSPNYVTGLFRGLRDSYKFPVNRRERLYVMS